MAKKSSSKPPVVVIFGDEEFQKATTLQRTIDELLPPEVDRGMALSDYDGTQSEEQGGPSLAAVMDDLCTLPFLSELRVVVIRDADKFITAYRERLEKYLQAPSPTGTLVLTCRSFPKNTRLYKAVQAIGGSACECKKLVGRALVDFTIAEARQRGTRLDPQAAARIVELVGQDQGVLSCEVEKLSLYVSEQPTITIQDVADLVGQSREEKIFPVMDAAATGRLKVALDLWYQVLATDPAAVYTALGGMAFVVRKWLKAQQMRAEGLHVRAIAPKVMMFNRADELETILNRLPPARLRRCLAAIAELDSQAKVGARSIVRGIEKLLAAVAAPAA